MEFAVTFTKTLTYTTTIKAKNYEAAEEKAQKMCDEANDGSLKNPWEVSLDCEYEGWEIEEIMDDE